jgi:hypothetical protein
VESPHATVGTEPLHAEGNLDLSGSTSPSSGDESKSHHFGIHIGKPKKKHPRIQQGLKSGLATAGIAAGGFIHDPKLHFGPC